jgi:hypothetical protein
MTLAAMLGRHAVSLNEVGEHLNLLGPRQRVAECVALSAAEQRLLWNLAAAGPGAEGALLPAAADHETFAGRNSLRVLSRFEKWFARQGESVIGCNRHALSWLIGPGYFSVEPDVARGGLRFDYRRVPAVAPDRWPTVASNSIVFAQPVYGDLVDEVRWVSAHVLVGSATRAGVSLGSYFVLARAPR